MRTAINPAFIILVLVAIHASPLLGQQQTTPSSPVDSVYWWTLTDEITPQELRAIHEDIELHKERYLEAVKAGTRRPKKHMELVNFFIDGSTHPELYQMWSAFEAFAITFGFEETDPRASLAEFGFEGEVLEKIVNISSEFCRDREILQMKVEELFIDVIEFARLSKASLGERNTSIAVKAKDVTMLANATGYSGERVEELLELWEQTPATDFAAQTLPLLKEVLGPTDWNRFRLYLVEVQAPMMSSLGYAAWEGN